MGRRTVALLAGMAGLVAAGCSDRRQQIPAAPLGTVIASTTLACDFASLSPLVTSYFRNNSTFRSLATQRIAEMEAAGAGTVVARDKGFNVLGLISLTVKAGNGGPVTDGSALVNGLLACMFNDAAELPAVFPEDFTAAIDPAVHGAFEIRGGFEDPQGVVYARPGLPATFSGVAPPQGTSWQTVLSGLPAPKRLLLYGRPGSTADSYDWKVVPRNAVFNPPLIVGLCIDPNANTTSMLQEQHVGLLTFADAYFLDPATCSPVAFTHWNPFQFASRLFGVRPLWAATVLNPGGLGGSTGGIGSEFNAHDLQTSSSGGPGGVILTFTIQPVDVRVNQILPAVQVSATSDGIPVGGVQVSLIAVNNNGIPAFLAGTITQTTPNSGLVTFTDLSLNKSGAYRLIASGVVVGRPAITVTGATSLKFNVRPAK